MWNNTPLTHNPRLPYPSPNLTLPNYHQRYPPPTSPHQWQYQSHTQYIFPQVASGEAISSPQMFSTSLRLPAQMSSNLARLPPHTSSISSAQAQSPFSQPPPPFVPCATKSEHGDKKTKLKELVNLLSRAPPPPPPPPAAAVPPRLWDGQNTISNNKVEQGRGVGVARGNRTGESETPTFKRICKDGDVNFQLNHNIEADNSNSYNCQRVGRGGGRGRRLERIYSTQEQNLVKQKVSDKPDPMLTIKSPAPAHQVPCPTAHSSAVEDQTLFSRRPPDTSVRRVWKPAKTVDYGGVWAPGVVANYGEELKEEFQPRRFDYEHGGEEGVNRSEANTEGTEEKVLKERKNEQNSEDGTNVEKKVYSRKRLVGFL